MVVSLKAQRAYVYRNGVRIGASTVSTGMKGHRTPTGIFTILQKKKDHRSNLYNDAPMPFMQRLTWDGIALHAGGLPGYPASHGCVRLPLAFATRLYDETGLGMTVVVTDGDPHPEGLEGAHILAPVTERGQSAEPGERLTKGMPYRWRPEASPTGPMTLILSARDHRVLVLRNGKEIGRSRCRAPQGLILGTHALQFNGFDSGMDARWVHIDLPGREAERGKPLDREGAAKVRLPDGFVQAVRMTLAIGDTLVITDESILSGGAGKAMAVITG